MPIFADFPMLPIGSVDGHAQYMARFNYRYYCASCIRSIEAEKKLDKCTYCNGTNLILLMEKEVKESVPWSTRIGSIGKFIQSLKKPTTKKKPQFDFSKLQTFQRFFAPRPKEEMPTR